MKQRRLVLFSGMGGDGRLMRPLRVPGIDVCTPDHVEPTRGEELSRYASRVADLQSIGASDVVGGASFGGMIAAEIARQRAVAGLILLGSCVRPDRLPWSYKWIERLGGDLKIQNSSKTLGPSSVWWKRLGQKRDP
jgi:esterase/lipase